MFTDYTATQTVNDKPRPRVLIYPGNLLIDFEWAKQRFDTWKFIGNLSEVDLLEWDLIITGANLSEWNGHGVRRIVPNRLYTFTVLPQDPQPETPILGGKEGERGYLEPGASTFSLKRDIPGNLVRRVDNLPEPLQDHIQQFLVPVAEARDRQYGAQLAAPVEKLAPTITEYRPFLVGPQGTALALSYRRVGGSRHWIVPQDAGDPGAWLDLALSEWHEENPSLFPNVGVWQTSATWMVNPERRAHDRLVEATRAFTEARERYELERARLTDAVEIARLGEGRKRRALITSKDDELQQAVLTALRELGFEVRDMDLEWPEKARREDYRISDTDDGTWLALADATGTTKGAKGNKFSTLQAHATKYLLQERPDRQPTLWLIVNHLLHRDPDTRRDLFTADDATVIASAGGLAIDTAALFVLVEAAEIDPQLRPAIRAWMRGTTGQLTLDMARVWLKNASAS